MQLSILKHIKKRKGSALLYFSIFLILGSIVAISLTKYYGPRREIKQTQLLNAKLEEVANAVSRFVSINSRLPCPASLNVALGDANFGTEESRDSNFECNAAGLMSNTAAGNVHYMGMVPVKALGLSDDYAIDSWGNKIEYVVSGSMYKSKSENNTNNYYSTEGILQVQDVNGTVMENSAAYILISRGKNQLGGSPATTSTNRIALPAVGSKERDNTECNMNSSDCGSTYFDLIFKSGDPSSNDDVLLYRNKTAINTNCQAGNTNTACNNIPCNKNQWTASGGSTIVITSSNLPQFTNFPTYTMPSGSTQQGMAYSVGFQLTALSTPTAAFKLMYDYKTTSSNTVNTVQIAAFSTAGMVGTYDATYVNQNISVWFGDANHIPQKLYFVMSGSGTASMTITNVFVNVKPIYNRDKLSYDIWTGVCDNGPGNNGQGQGNPNVPNSNKNCQGNSGNQQAIDSVNTKNPNCMNFEESCNLDDLLNSSRYPNSPDYHGLISVAEGIRNYGDYYHSRIYGYFTPNETATYTFYVAADSIAQLYLSSDSNPNNAQLVASRTQASASRGWTATGGSPSVAISLVGGKSYFFSLIHRAYTGATDNLALGCAKASNTGTTSVDVLGLGTDAAGCGGTLSTAPMQNVLTQVQCQQ